MDPLKIFISAGDPSGERHAARLIRALRKISGEPVVTGIGGEAMQKEGAQLLCTQDRLAIMGLLEVVKHLPFFIGLLRRIREHLTEHRPELMVLIDFPDFNFRLAKIAKELGIPVLYYISPQIWAWRTGRKRQLASLASHLAVVFPFEVEFYRDENIPVEFVGHPLVAELEGVTGRSAFRSTHGLETDRPLVGLMPGSRVQEIERHMELFLAAARRMRARHSELQFAVAMLKHTAAALSPGHREMIEKLGVKTIEGDSLGLISASDVLLTKSGTTTMEAALLGTPMVISYRTSAMSYLIASRLVKISHIGMPNLLDSSPSIPELIQHEVTPERIAQFGLELLEKDSPLRARVLEQCQRVRQVLTTDKPASVRVAEIALEMTGRRAD
jgi:lipid-A-disaccharide synthase